MLIGFVLLFVSAAEAITGHCSAAEDSEARLQMSAHCALMMGVELPEEVPQNSSNDSSACCCEAFPAPIIFQLSVFANDSFEAPSWARSLNVTGHSIPDKVAIPPPRA